MRGERPPVQSQAVTGPTTEEERREIDRIAQERGWDPETTRIAQYRIDRTAEFEDSLKREKARLEASLAKLDGIVLNELKMHFENQAQDAYSEKNEDMGDSLQDLADVLAQLNMNKQNGFSESTLDRLAKKKLADCARAVIAAKQEMKGPAHGNVLEAVNDLYAVLATLCELKFPEEYSSQMEEIRDLVDPEVEAAKKRMQNMTVS